MERTNEINEQRLLLENITELAHMLKELTIQQHKINQKIITVLRIFDKKLMDMSVINDEFESMETQQ